MRDKQDDLSVHIKNTKRRLYKSVSSGINKENAFKKAKTNEYFEDEDRDFSRARSFILRGSNHAHIAFDMLHSDGSVSWAGTVVLQI